MSAHWPHLFTRAFVAPDVVRLLRTSDEAAARSVVECMEDGVRLAPSYPAIAASALRCRGLLDDDPDTLVAAVDAYSRTERVSNERCAPRRPEHHSPVPVAATRRSRNSATRSTRTKR